LCEVIEELGIEEETIAITGVGCGFRNYLGFDLDGMCVPHGRAPDVATGIKRSLGGKPMVFTLQGDGDCIAIGAESLINAAARAERITVLMVNNANYGTTGGQLAPTTLMGQRTTTTPEGREPSAGYPIHTAELLASIKGVAYSARSAVNTPVNYQRTRRCLKTAFRKQLEDIGFSFVEILSACPPDWHLSPLDSLKWIEEKLIAEFPLGEFKNVPYID
jgi:2-oxoglutarate ferredoxin oxidoreductase subunit beta